MGFSSLLGSSNSLSKKSWYKPQYLEYRLSWDIYTPYTGTARFWLPLWYLQTLVLYWSFTLPLVSYFFLTHLREVLCLFTQDFTILRNWHSCQWNKYGFEISWLGHKSPILYLIRTKQCCCYLNSFRECIFLSYLCWL